MHRRPARPLTLLLSPVLLCALSCKNGSATSEDNPITENGTTNGSDEVVSLDETDPGTDSDGDGLSDLLEQTGWTIQVDETGAPDVNGFVFIEVTSDPTLGDSDGDGLADGDERAAGSHPRRVDTDRDGLNDAEEVLRWRTSPVTVDTDADARGPDAAVGTAPDSRLFDGAELSLVPSPTIDGLLVASTDATSPLDPDTDGDGVWDGVELASSFRNPVVAEMPELRVTQAPDDSLGIYLDVVFREDQSSAGTISAQLDNGASTTAGVSSTASLMVSSWMSFLYEVGVTLDVGLDLDSLGAQVGISVREEAHLGTSASTSFTAGLSSTFETTAAQAFTEAGEVLRSQEREISGGRMVTSLSLENAGVIPFSVQNPNVNVAYIGDDGTTRPLGVLEPQNPEDAYTLAVGESIDLVVEDLDIPAERLLELLANPQRLIFTPANAEVVDAGEDQYAFVEEDVLFRTSAVVLDFGDGTVQRHQVATHVPTDSDGNPVGVDVSALLTVVGVDHDDGDQGNGAYRIESYPTVLHTGIAPDLQAEGLDVEGYVFTDGPGERPLREGWAAFVERADGEIQVETNLMAIRALPGDTVSFIRAVDEDRDGVIAFVEALNGASDDALDSDGDGLSDYWEVEEGWLVEGDRVLVEAEGQPARHVTSSAGSPDADADGLTDREEYALGTHPRRADTDGDGLPDAGDADPLSYDFVRLTDIRVTMFDCSLEGCRNDWPDTPGYNLVALGWDATDGVTGVVLREVHDSGAPAQFDPSTIRTLADIDAAVASGAVSRVYEGLGVTTEDYDVQADQAHTYFFFGVVAGIDGVDYAAYSGSDSVLFEPAAWSPEYYHVVRVGIEGFVLDENHHGDGHQQPWDLYYRHEIEVRYGDPASPDVVAGMDPGLQQTFVLPPTSPAPPVLQDDDFINDSFFGGTHVVRFIEPVDFPFVTVCVRDQGHVRVGLHNFDRDPVEEYPCTFPGWAGLPNMPTPDWGQGPIGCDDRQIANVSYPLNDPLLGSNQWQDTTSAEIGVGIGGEVVDETTTWIHREDFPDAKDRDWYSQETSRPPQGHAATAYQHVAFDYLGYLRDVDAALLCDVGFGVNPVTP